MHDLLKNLCWPLARLGEGVEELAVRAGLYPDKSGAKAAPTALQPEDIADLERWLGWVSEGFGLEAEALEITLTQC